MIDDVASEWAVRLEGGPLSAEAQAELDKWLAIDERHHGALLRAEAALAYINRARAMGPVDEINAEIYAANDDGPKLNRRAFIGGAVAASVAVGLAVIGNRYIGMSNSSEIIEIATAVGEVRRVPLGDGSVAAINTASKVSVSMGVEKRTIKLNEGEAWFQVAHDKLRPFVVEAGDVRVRAVGTAFSVRRREDGADILVTEGVVETWVVGHELDKRLIEAGGKGFVADVMPKIEVAKAPDVVDRQLAWRQGELALNGESLSYAVAEFNRYNDRKLVVADSLSNEPLVGYFRTNEPENFGRAVAEMVGARIETRDGSIYITR